MYVEFDTLQKIINRISLIGKLGHYSKRKKVRWVGMADS